MTMGPEALDALVSGLVGSGLLTDLSCVHSSPERVRLDAKRVVSGVPRNVRVELDEDFPMSLPHMFLDGPQPAPCIPHLMSDGRICWAETGSLRWDLDNPVDILVVAVERAIQTLETGLSGRNHEDFANEFESYWNKGTFTANCYLEPSSGVRVAAAKARKGRHLEIGTRETLWTLGLASSADALEPVLFVPLEGAIRPPGWDEVLWDGDEVRRLLAAAPSHVRAALRAFSKTEPSPIMHLVLQVPRPAGGESFVGLSLINRSPRAHPFSFGAEEWKAIFMDITRADSSYLIARGGAHLNLLKKSVLLVGCGAVGGHVAFELARAGVGKLTLVDGQRLAFDNVYRHVLGRRFVGSWKASSLREALKDALTTVHVEAVDMTFGKAVRAGRFNLSDFDLVLFATGDPNFELDMNKELWLAPKSRAVFAWVEPLGLGGHVIRTQGREPGCLECTYDSWKNRGTCRISFAGTGQTFSRSLTGCGSSFTPYGSADAVQTAVLAVRAGVEALLDEAAGPEVRSWKGTDAFFGEFKVSRRWDECGPLTALAGGEFRRSDCRVCGSGRR